MKPRSKIYCNTSGLDYLLVVRYIELNCKAEIALSNNDLEKLIAQDICMIKKFKP